MAISPQILLYAIAFPDGYFKHFLSEDISEDDIKAIQKIAEDIPYDKTDNDRLPQYMNKLCETVREKLNIEIRSIDVSEVFRKRNGAEHIITKNMIKTGYEKGIVKLIDSPHLDGTVCEIGEYWFYFGGQTAEDLTAEEYKINIPEEDIINNIFAVLDDAKYDDKPISKNEYLYYEAILRESGCA